MSKIQKIVSISILVILIIILILTNVYYNFASSINIVVSIIAIMAFFGGYSKLMDLFELKSNLTIEKVEVTQDRARITIEIKNKGNTYSYNPNVNFAVMDEKNKVIDSGFAPLFGSKIGILPTGSFTSKVIKLNHKLEKNKKYIIFIAMEGKEYYQDLKFESPEY